MDMGATINPENKVPNTGRDLGLDFLKVLATIAVVKLHCGSTGVLGETAHYICGFAVPIFFMVSGALILNKKSLSTSYCGKKAVQILLFMAQWDVLLVLAKLVLKGKVTFPFLNVLKAALQQGQTPIFGIYGH